MPTIVNGARRALRPAMLFALALLLTIPSLPAAAAVSTYTGRYEYTWKDFGLADDDPLTFRRAYNSVDPYVGPLGPGWAHNFNVHLARINGHPEGDRMFVGPTGLQSLFTLRPDGSFEPGPHAGATLQKVALSDVEQAYVLNDDDGTIYRFQEGGLPVEITFPNKERVVLTHDAQGHLLAVTRQPDGKRVLRLSYSDDGSRLVSVSDSLPIPRRVSYAYDQLGRLVGVTNRLGYVTRYTYNGETSFLHEIVDARGHVALTMEHDERGRVRRQQNPRSVQEGTSTTFDYEMLNDGTRRTTAVYPPSTFAPSFPVPVVDTVDPQAATLTRRTETGPGDEPVVETRRPDPQRPAGRIERSGGKTAAPAAGGTPLSEATLPGLAFPLRVKLGTQFPVTSDLAPQPERSPHQIADALRSLADERTVDQAGRLTGAVVSSRADRLDGTWHIEYDDEDRVVSVSQSGPTERATSYRYDEVGNVVEIVGPDGSIRQFEYDDRDSLVGFQDGLGATWHYEYDERFHLARTTVTPAGGGPARTAELRYDGLGRLRLVRDLTDPAAPSEIELQYDLYTVVGIWERSSGGTPPPGGA